MEIARFWILVDQLVGQNGTKMIRPDSVGALDPNPPNLTPNALTWAPRDENHELHALSAWLLLKPPTEVGPCR